MSGPSDPTCCALQERLENAQRSEEKAAKRWRAVVLDVELAERSHREAQQAVRASLRADRALQQVAQRTLAELQRKFASAQRTVERLDQAVYDLLSELAEIEK